ncbi:TetR/AcrR family transcriptional regulator [Nonomuraea typhae]|uniref:TetR/AcrR family transcriptional regulator n=1 Tax=Nonomuraea typhae TaxID=2603600 RepID=UPI0015E1BB9F|nr:TetR/AcrR family transcriptional regulator [Nonomuraea typhae]
MRERADRILDAATELLVQLGFKKVTIEDVAQRAAIGKGTVYLHWRTKKELFQAVFLRAAVAYTDGLREALRRDPATVRPHRLLAESYRLVVTNPVLFGMVAADSRATRDALADIAARSWELMATTHFFEVLGRHKLLRADVPDLPYAMAAVGAGFYMIDAIDPVTAARDLREKAASLSFVVRHAFEPPAEPGPEVLERAAADLLTAFDELVPPYEKWIYGED